MDGFVPYEIAALKLLIGPVLGADFVNDMSLYSSRAEVQMHDDGYDIVVRHSKLPNEIVAIGSPNVIGRLGSLRVRFLVKIEGNTLRLLCRTPKKGGLPVTFRQSDVSISIN